MQQQNDENSKDWSFRNVCYIPVITGPIKHVHISTARRQRHNVLMAQTQAQATVCGGLHAFCG